MRSTHSSASAIRAPGLHLMALESRAPLEAIGTLALWPLLMRGPAGDGHSVMVIPGLAAPDSTTAMLRGFLRRRGYRAHRWGQGFNLGPRDGVIEASLERVRALHRKSGRRISLVGWSLGGVYARELAKMAPEAVRVAISLGTPFTGPARATNAWRVYELVSGQRVGEHALHAGLHEPPPVPTTSIYSRSDGVVAWPCSIQPPRPRTENIEVRASHMGMGAHPAVLHAIADRLAQPEGDWAPFAPSAAWRWAYGRGSAR